MDTHESPESLAASSSWLVPGEILTLHEAPSRTDFIAKLITAIIMRRGTRTTEFWFLIIGLAVVATEAFMGSIPASWAAIAAIATPIGWAVLRSLLKIIAAANIEKISSNGVNSGTGEPSTELLVKGTLHSTHAGEDPLE